MYSFEFHKHGNRATYGTSYFYRMFCCFIILVLGVALFSIIREEGSFEKTAVFPTLFMALLFMMLLYRESWTFDNDKREILYVLGFGPFVKKKRYLYDEVVSIEVRRFVKGESGNISGRPLFSNKPQTLFSVRLNRDDVKSLDLERAPERRNKARLERSALFLSEFAGFPLNSFPEKAD